MRCHNARYHCSFARSPLGSGRTVRGPRDFSRGIRTQFSRTEGSRAPGSGVAVSSSGSLWCPENFEHRVTFLSGGFSREKKPFFGSLWGHPERSRDGSVRAGPCAGFAACRDSRRGGPPSRGRIHGPASRPGQVLSSLPGRFLSLFHRLWISRSQTPPTRGAGADKASPTRRPSSGSDREEQFGSIAAAVKGIARGRGEGRRRSGLLR
jgi:hypothetical protein